VQTTQKKLSTACGANPASAVEKFSLRGLPISARSTYQFGLTCPYNFCVQPRFFRFLH